MGAGKINVEILRKLELFADVSNESLEALSQIMRIVPYPKGSHVFQDKEKLDSVYIVFSGKFNIYKISDSSDKRVIFLQGIGVLLNDNLRPDLPSAVYCESFEDSAALVCSKQDFLNIMSQDFNFTQAVIDQYSSKLRRTYRQLKNAPTNIAIEKKLAAKFYALSRDYGVETSDGILIDIPLTVTNISEMLGAQRETISRSIKKLTKEELIVYKNKKILIRDLNEIVDFYRKKKKV